MAGATSSFADITAALGADLITERGGRIAASPSTTGQVAAVLQYADAHGCKVEIAGAGTKRAWAGRPEGELVLETRGLNGVREHSWQDLTASVAAGTTWAEMQRVLAQHGQRVALDPLWPERATVGGVVATNDSGALRLKYGSLRDLVIGMTLVLADGTIARSGGKVVKNVAGYDLHKLMIGAYGTLAVVTEVTFRLHSLPRHTRVRSITANNPDVIATELSRILNSHLDVQAMQFRTENDGFVLDVELTGIEQPAESGLGTPSENPVVFRARERLFAEEGVMVKATMLVSSIARIAAAVARMGGVAVVQASGILYARFPLAASTAALAELRSLVHAEDGSMMVLRGSDGFGVIPDSGSSVPLMREIMHRFDPNRTLNPGLAVGA